MKQTINIALATMAVALIITGYVLISHEVPIASYLSFAGFILMIPAIMYQPMNHQKSHEKR